MAQQRSRIINHQKLSDTYYKLTLESREISALAKPGQFVNVRVNSGTCPLLRRPFAVHRKDKDKELFELLYEVVGNGTRALSMRKIGEELDVIGPLGNGFKIDREKKSAILVAGGIGIAPLACLAEELIKQKKEVFVILGSKTNNFNWLSVDGYKLSVCTEDGSAGHKGLATDILENMLSTIPYTLSAIYACGPKAMLKAAAGIALSKQADCQISLEEKLACGIGACLGCSVKTKNGYKLVCKDGPVFNSGEIIW